MTKVEIVLFLNPLKGRRLFQLNSAHWRAKPKTSLKCLNAIIISCNTYNLKAFEPKIFSWCVQILTPSSPHPPHNEHSLLVFCV